MPTSEPSVVVTVANNVAVIRLNRPKRMNAFDRPMYELLRDTLRAVDADDRVTLALLTGTGKWYSSGYVRTVGAH